jgi:hypothetical protein
MSQPDTTSQPGQSARQPTTLSAETRVDPPHPVNRAQWETTDDDGSAAEGPAPDEAIAQRLHTQASQLACYLRSREEELDHRQAAVNAQMAQLERDARTARLWLAETESQTEQLQHELRESRREAEQQARNQQQRWAAQQQRATAELARNRQAVERRSEHLEQCRRALQELCGEVGRMHHETLQMRLAIEELWAELSAAAPPPGLADSLARIRSRLDEQYRLAGAELQAQREELDCARKQLAEQHQRLAAEKIQLEQAVARRHEEAAQQAANLAAREEQLARREAELHEQATIQAMPRPVEFSPRS